MDLSPRGDMGLTGMFDGQIQLWDYSTGQEIRRLQGHRDMIFAGARFRPDHRTVVSASGNVVGETRDNSIRLWDIETGVELHRFEAHRDSIWHLSLSPDGGYTASGGRDGMIYVCDLERGTHWPLYHTDHEVRNVAFSPDGRYVMCSLAPGQLTSPDAHLYSLRLIEVATGREVCLLSGHEEVVRSVAFSPDGRLALSGSTDHSITLWDVARGQAVYRLDHYTSVTKVVFDPNRHLAVAGTMDGDLALFEVSSGRILRYFHGHARVVYDLVFCPDGQSFWSAAGDDTVRQWRVETSQADVLDWIATRRYVPEFTPEQRQRYGIETLEEIGRART